MVWQPFGGRGGEGGEDGWEEQLLARLAAEEAANNIRLAQANKGTCPILTCRERVGETKEGRWFHLTGPDAGGRACFDPEAT